MQSPRQQLFLSQSSVSYNKLLYAYTIQNFSSKPEGATSKIHVLRLFFRMVRNLAPSSFNLYWNLDNSILIKFNKKIPKEITFIEKK